jgi:RimJ/RimL family protein N-acetyltransferase
MPHHVDTARLRLEAITLSDLDELHALSADPRVWEHYPSGRHTDLDTTRGQVESFVGAWRADGLGYWTARLRENGEFAGVGGCMLRHGLAWNIYYRFRPEMQGNGYASELVSAALRTAAEVRPELPVIAYMVEHNVASWRTAQRSGLRRVWRGPDAGNPDPCVVRLIYADRDLDERTLAALTGNT